MILLLALALADIGGNWRATAPDGGQEVVLELKQSGEAVSGSMTAAGSRYTIKDGLLRGNSLSFCILIPSQGRRSPQCLTGKFEGGELRLDDDEMPLVFRRFQAAPGAARVERLAGLMRGWGAIKFFHPYLAYRPIDWDRAFLNAIPRVEAARTTKEYAAALEAMVAELKDPETRVLREGETLPEVPAGPRRRLVRNAYYVDWETVDAAPPYATELPEGVRVVMRTGEPLGASTEITTTEPAYDTGLPSRELMLLALARYWNTIRYFFGYHAGIPSWDAVLTEAVPRFEAAGTWREYVFAIARLAAQTRDSHSVVPQLRNELGDWPDLDIWPVAGQSVVRGAAVGVERGDVITAVNGEDVTRRRQFLLDLIPNSTPYGGLLQANQWLLAGHGPEVKVRVRKADGREVEATLRRSGGKAPGQRGPVYEVLPGGIGYIDLGRLEVTDVDRAFDAVLETHGLIFDMRGYPRQTAPAVASRLTERRVPAALIDERTWHGPDPSISSLEREVQYAWPSAKPKYKGRVAVLIDARAMSQAEHACLYLEAAANATFIGSPTRGSDGSVTNTLLPGGVRVNFAGMEIRHADGRPLQRVGILPHIWVEPTIAGLRQGRDEVMERAVEFLKAAGAGQ